MGINVPLLCPVPRTSARSARLAAGSAAPPTTGGAVCDGKAAAWTVFCHFCNNLVYTYVVSSLVDDDSVLYVAR